MAREAMQLRRGDGGSALRPTGAAAFNSALRSDYVYTDIPNAEGGFLSAESLGYSTVSLMFTPQDVITNNPYAPYLDPNAFVIVRSPAGIPTTPQDGYQVSRYDFTNATPVDIAEIAQTLDTGLIQGQWYYYGLFARYTPQSGPGVGNTYWMRVSHLDVLVPYNFGYADRLWSMIPAYYRDLDADSSGSYTHSGQLRRYIEVIGYEIDIQRTYAMTLGDLWDISRINARLLENLGEVLGIDEENVVGDKRYRNILANIMYLRKFSGTKDGIEGYLTSATAYKTLVYVGKNMLLDPSDSDLRVGLGHWNVGFPDWGWLQTVTSAGEAGGPGNGQRYFRFSNGSGAVNTLQMIYGNQTNPSVFDPKIAMPVKPGHRYRMSSLVRHSETAKTIRWSFKWYSVSGALLSTTDDAEIPVGIAWGLYASAYMTAPVGAAFAIPVVSGISMSASAQVNLWRIMMVDEAWVSTGIPTAVGPDTTWESPRKVWVNLYPQRTNFAVNSSFAVNGVGWIATEPATYSLLPFAYASYAILAPKPITNKVRSGGVATITTSRAHNLIVGNNVNVDCNDNTFDGTFTVVSIPTSTTFTYANAGADVASSAATGLVTGPEISYVDLLAGFDTISNSTTMTFDTTNRWMTITSGNTAAPYQTQVSSNFFPVIFNVKYSARVEAMSLTPTATGAILDEAGNPLLDEAGNVLLDEGGGTGEVTMLLRFQWYSGNSIDTEIIGSSVFSPPITLHYNQWDSVVIGNATPPPGARYGRLVIQGNNPNILHAERLRRVIIEDNPVPGPYFDGTWTEGAYGDYRFTGTAHQSFSVYHMNFNAVLNGLLSSDRVRTLLPSLIPPERDFGLNTVLNGLLG